MANVGERLQQARVRAGLSVREIAARTKIRTVLLEAIEREDFRQLPQGILGRGYLRAYAREVGLDPESVVRQFQDECEREAARLDAAPASAVETGPKDDRRRTYWLQVLAAVTAGVLAVFIVLGRDPGMDERGEPAPISTVGAETEAIIETGGQDSEQGAERIDDIVAAVDTPEVPSLTVAISPAGVVWVDARADGRRVLYQLVHPGEQRVITARDEIQLLVGDAGAFRYSISGVPGRRLGAAGAVRTIRITHENYSTFQEQ
jgi:cytoskeleton protein RodZ